MLDAVAQLGILLLLLITGMETNLSVPGCAPPRVSVSLSGVICGMNARGSTEVIVATIALQLGALNPSGRSLLRAVTADAVVREIIAMREHYGVEVRGEIRSSGTLRNALLRELTRAHYDLLVMGVSPRPRSPRFSAQLGASRQAQAALVVPRCRLAASQTVAG